MKRIGIINRGEPAIRFLSALDALRREEPRAPAGVALYTDADADSLYVRLADHAVHIGEGRRAYLDADRVIAGLREGGCDAAWLGWGFASEDGAFCAALEAADIRLLAPRPETMLQLGDKIAAKRLAEEHEVPVAPWAVVDTPEAALIEAERIGFPLMIKAAGGGGGRGIRRVDDPQGLAEALASARAEADRSFHGGGIFLERCVDGARHVEVQVLGDGEGRVLVLGVRECSLQRRRQKIIEECPSPALSQRARMRLAQAAERLATAVRYRSAGTVEFLYDERADAAYFLEVNTRLQVEHPVTEEVFGIDLVRAQIDLARGRSLPAASPSPRGWAVEARVCAEDPQNDFAPAPGRLVRFVLPTGPGLRVDTGFTEGEVISADFDPLVAKIIAWGPDRKAALARLSYALTHTRVVVEGGTTNLAFLRALVASDDVRAGRFDIGYVDRLRVEPPSGAGIAALAAALDRFLAGGDTVPGREPDRHRVEVGVPLAVYRTGPETFLVVHEDGEICLRYEAEGPYQRWLSLGSGRHRIERAPGDAVYVVDGSPHRVAAASGGAVTAPSAAMVLALPVSPGDHVEAGDCVAIVESMKMEVRVEAPRAGVVREVAVSVGAAVRGGQTLLLLDIEGAEAPVDTPLSRVPWQRGALSSAEAQARVHAAFIGWDAPPDSVVQHARRVASEGAEALLRVFADVAEMFERRPERERDASSGATEAVAPSVWLETLVQRGPSALSARARAAIGRALDHHGVESLDEVVGADDVLLRLGRAGEALVETIPAAVALAGNLRRPAHRLFDRLTRLDPIRFGPVREAADRARYLLVERPAQIELTHRAEERAEAMLQRLRAGEMDWPEVIAAPESLVPGMAPEAADGDPIAAEGVARRLEWTGGAQRFARFELGGLPAFRIDVDAQAVVCVTGRLADVPRILADAADMDYARRLDLVLVPQADQAAEPVLTGAVDAARPFFGPQSPWDELCLLAIRGPGYPAVRRFHGDGRERLDRRDVMPSTARRLDLDRLERFDFQRLPSDDDVVLFHARARENPRDVRLLAFGEVRSLEPSPEHRLRLPHIERVFHAAVRAIEAARQTHDPKRRLQWNRITLRIVPAVEHSPERIRRYILRHASAAIRIGLEKVVVRARFVDPDTGKPGPLMDLSISNRTGHRLDIHHRRASHRPLAPLTPYESRVVAARRRGLTYPYEIISMLRETSGLPRSRFIEYDLGPGGAAQPVDRPAGGNQAGVVFGVIHSERPEREGALSRVLLLSDPTRRMGSLAEPECTRIVAALDLATRLEMPVEWVAISAGARIDWETGTENLDWTAQVLARLIRFTQAGGEVNIIVPGICVGAQAYWNAEATMMMHTRGLLIMTDQGTMVLTGKRALDASGCVSAEDDLALGGYTAIMGPNGQAQAHATDLVAAYRLLYRYYAHTFVRPGERRPGRVFSDDPAQRDVTAAPYPVELGHGFDQLGQLFSVEHNPDRKRPFAVRPIMSAVVDRGVAPVERWAAWRGAETAVVWEARIGGFGATVIGIENQPVGRVGQQRQDGPAQLAPGTLYPQASRKVARALNAASGRRPVVVLANLSGFDGSPESLGHWQLEYGAEIGRAVVNFDGPIIFAVLSRYHGGAYVVFSKQLNPALYAFAVEGSFASVIGGAPAASVVFAGAVRKRAAELGGGPEAQAQAVSELATRFDGVHTVERARKVGSLDTIVAASALRPTIVERLAADHQAQGSAAAVSDYAF